MTLLRPWRGKADTVTPMNRPSVARFTALGLWVALAVWLGSDAGLPIAGVLVLIYGGGGWLVLWLLVVVWNVRRRSALTRWWIEPLVVTLVFAFVGTGLGFRARFAVSAAALERYARASARNRISHQRPVYVGLFRIYETEIVNEDCIRLITTSCGFDECGVVLASSEPPRIGEDTYESIGKPWWRWHRSW